ncbi:MAG: 2'-5' RNA ligase family protein [Lachnospiraceae bacterium]|nr:2'-5' RNA ligase family protein [Lachnospiraceae bacterium]
MYLITAYFDDITTKQLQRIIDEIAKVTGNTFMVDNEVVPHMTISAFDAKSEEVAISLFDKMKEKLSFEDVLIPTAGVFLPYVIYAQAVQDQYLCNLSSNIYHILTEVEGIRVNRYYLPYGWIPHITLGKKLDKDQMQLAFQVVQEKFQPIKAHINTFGISKPNPLRNLDYFTYA